MSRLVATIDLTAASVGKQGTFATQTPNACSALYVMNESACFLQLDLGSNGQPIVQPWRNRLFQLPQAIQNAQWTIIAVLQSGGSPASAVYVEAFAPNETPPAGTLDGPVFRQSNIGNSVPVGTSATSITNDGNAVGTVVVEATPTGAGGSQAKLTNDGDFLCGGGLFHISNAGVVTAIPAGAIPQTAIGAGYPAGSLGAGTLPAGVAVPETNVGAGYPAANVGAGTLAANVHQTSINSDGGKVTTDGAGTFTGVSLQSTGGISALAPAAGAYDALKLGNSHDATYAGLAGYADPTYGAGAGLYVWDAKNAGYILSAATKNGITFGGKITSDGGRFATDGLGNLNARRITPAYGGSLAGASPINGSGSATVNHGLSATPDAAVVNTANGSNSTTFGSGSYTATTVYIYQFNAQAWVGLVYAH